MEMRIAVKVDVVQVLEITQCLHRQDVDAQLSGSRAWLQDRYLPVDWPILLKYHPELQKGEPLRLWVPTLVGDCPQGTPPADCDLRADEVMEITMALWNWDGPALVCRLWNLVYAALSWGMAQELADQGACIDLSTIAGRKGFIRLMEKQAQLHGAAKIAVQDEEAARAELRATLGARSHGRKRMGIQPAGLTVGQRKPDGGPDGRNRLDGGRWDGAKSGPIPTAPQQESSGRQVRAAAGTVREGKEGYAVKTVLAGGEACPEGLLGHASGPAAGAGPVSIGSAANGGVHSLPDREDGVVTITVAGSAVRVALAGGPAACVVTSYAG